MSFGRSRCQKATSAQLKATSSTHNDSCVQGIAQIQMSPPPQTLGTLSISASGLFTSPVSPQARLVAPGHGKPQLPAQGVRLCHHGIGVVHIACGTRLPFPNALDQGKRHVSHANCPATACAMPSARANTAPSKQASKTKSYDQQMEDWQHEHPRGVTIPSTWEDSK